MNQPCARAADWQAADGPAPTDGLTFCAVEFFPPVATLRGMHLLKTPLGRLRVIGCGEGISFLVLLGVAMPLKYLAGRPGAVRVVGMAHGVLFLLYVAAALQARRAQHWTWRRTGLVLLASLLPAGPFVADARLLRHEPPADPTPPPAR